ncbi:MAG: hypothetical protein KDB22_28435, partial [Planctomycetales bacterium]|nr:hypothetical protein [Planctomycetales bacterium]
MTKTQLSSQCEDVDDLLGQAVDEYLQAVADGKQLDVEQLATAYPSIANLIRRTLPALEMMDVS